MDPFHSNTGEAIGGKLHSFLLKGGGSKHSLASCVLNISGIRVVRQVSLASPLDLLLY